MATIQECRGALDRLSDNLVRAEEGVRGAAAFDRSLSCHITDLDQTFTGRLDGGRIHVEAVAPGPPARKAEIRLAMAGDDLVALVAGELKFAKAWASGRVRLEAGFRDLLRLKSLLSS
ncbi:SCP2 sterol-binding domain-containing protein [Streptomyces sp. NPDC058892]|uniref:SCP2 sterol-binding domain-containing protein n=1 Tax=unclassified Streptomyces TaxID=2593676 RepID=UPI0036968345